ncbi:hypothetical protein E4U30_000729 [Claviceps sp. LM220 group G6]|nr:hypothetical protein E4U15_003486 [Claviceps sp. LM218 group G6]KAG6097386.1 hypothetical protein E4U30_000729 [Claviceps sp. LM220 group G6]KAG6101531.1 hypothetical protein E4U31_003643 [Claviceps sp. LM219 group G6]
MPDYILYAYFRSSCSARLRIILHLKNIPFQHIPINILQDQQLSDQHRALNPSASVPLLVCPQEPKQDQKDQKNQKDNEPGFRIGQSLAAMEYLEEVHPEIPALPPSSDPRSRALVRVLCAIIASDIQPVTNLRITRRVRALGGVPEDWNKDLMEDGLRAYEEVVKGTAGRYSVGDSLTMADACLMPAVWNAQRYGVEVDRFPTVARVAGNLSEHPAVRKAEYFRQEDCPEELRK